MNYVLYHKNCYDGFGAAFAAFHAFTDLDTQYISVGYNEPFPELELCSNVYIVDFSYPKDILLNLCELHEKVVVLDHHKTAQEMLQGIEHPKLTIVFDMTKSGALLTWEYFFPSRPAPELIQYISDRDLWQFKLPNSKEVHEALVSYPMDFSAWEHLSIDQLKKEGVTCKRLYDSLVDKICEKVWIKNIANYEIPIVNTSIAWSEVGNRLLELFPNAKFAASFTIEKDMEMWSLRSRKDFDVSEIAKKFGGGGHAQASGFKIPRN